MRCQAGNAVGQWRLEDHLERDAAWSATAGTPRAPGASQDIEIFLIFLSTSPLIFLRGSDCKSECECETIRSSVLGIATHTFPAACTPASVRAARCTSTLR